eukprot:Pgem_evm1s12186
MQYPNHDYQQQAYQGHLQQVQLNDRLSHQPQQHYPQLFPNFNRTSPTDLGNTNQNREMFRLTLFPNTPQRDLVLATPVVVTEFDYANPDTFLVKCRQTVYPDDASDDPSAVTLLFNDIGQCLFGFDQIYPNQIIENSTVDFINKDGMDCSDGGGTSESDASSERRNSGSSFSSSFQSGVKNIGNTMEYFLLKAENQIRTKLDPHSTANSVNDNTASSNLNVQSPPRNLNDISDYSHLTPQELYELQILKCNEANHIRKNSATLDAPKFTDNNTIVNNNNNNTASTTTTTTNNNNGDNKDSHFDRMDEEVKTEVKTEMKTEKTDAAKTNANLGLRGMDNPKLLEATDSQIEFLFANIQLETLSLSKISLANTDIGNTSDLTAEQEFEQYERQQRASEKEKSVRERSNLEKGHKAADRRSREKIRNNINDLKESIPSSLFKSGKKTAKATLFQKVTDYMKFTLAENERLREETEENKAKIKKSENKVKSEFTMLKDRRCYPPAVIMFSAKDYRISFVDHNFLLMSGFPMNEIIGKKVGEVVAWTHHPLSGFEEEDVDKLDKGLKRINTTAFHCLRGSNPGNNPMNNDKSQFTNTLKIQKNGVLENKIWPWRGLCLLTTRENALIGFLVKCEPCYSDSNDPDSGYSQFVAT